ncbi:MAG: type I glyceraldehyde-3-phosphate dehydrogenase [Candidatus Cyclobacteriaceae bacterium M2_1C_046]
MTKVAINGLGRIGRATLKVIMDTPELELVAVNDIVPLENIEYLLKYDSVYGRYEKDVAIDGDGLKIGTETIKFLSEKDPANLPWNDMGIDLVFECSGIFTDKEGMQKHIDAGAKRVILSAPAKSDGIPTVVHGVNEADGSEKLISTASCTTNSIAPVMEIIDRRIGVKKAIMTTVHAYTSSQELVDGPSKKMRRGRAAAVNFVPTTTGAAKATGKALPQLEGIFDGLAIRGPVPAGSISDITIVTAKPTSAEEINKIFREEANTDRYDGVIGLSDDELVSSDIVKDSRAAIIDGQSTTVVDGDLVKVMSWYDNEWGYVNQMVREGKRVASLQEEHA